MFVIKHMLKFTSIYDYCYYDYNKYFCINIKHTFIEYKCILCIFGIYQPLFAEIVLHQTRRWQRCLICNNYM